VRADKACSSRAVRRHLRERHVVAVIPAPSDQRGHTNDAVHAADARPRSIGSTTAAATSSSAGFCDVEQWRGLATRYEKLALTFRGAAVLKAIVTWLHALACR
jgi:hypothetical protein